ncbi:MAG TPA: hypothetical protein VKT53_01805 [Candidatus Acidoferrum sp.]|nr:hypothetical protein [Candidatus Acidoferrum sp.]
MNEHKSVVWFANDAKPNDFFFRSPFQSWKFRVNTAVVVALSLGLIFVLFKNWSKWSLAIRFAWIAFFILQGTLYPFLRILQSHRKINELYLAGKITEQSAESPIDELLSVADNALNDGLFYSLTVLGMLAFSAFVIGSK